ncbi:MAG: ATP-binding protein [Candidatus Hatepunaea meridiana]|nr:ATP-binding protein [Candidatus Hatepunaea meridiana]
MWVDELRLENIKCFKALSLKLTQRGEPYKWITMLGENGVGKSTAIQALGLLMAGPDGAKQLLPRPEGWLREETEPGKITVRLHRGKNDPGIDRVPKSFGYTFFLTGNKKLSIRNKEYSEPTIQESSNSRLIWLRKNAFSSESKGWFAVGYGAFRRLTRSSQIIIPSLEQQARYTNFITQYNEDQPLSAFERWLVYLEFRIVKDNDHDAKRYKELGIAAINKVLPDGVEFDSINSEARILFRIGNQKVPTIALSDGYRSILALSGDLIWRLIQAFPESDDPLKEEGVVLIDELDIHLHPTWQRDISFWLREQFPNLQFFVATHSPLIAAGAGEDALTLKFDLIEGEAKVKEVKNVYAMNIDRILQSEAFSLVSTYSPQTQSKIDRYDTLIRKGSQRTEQEEEEFGHLSLIMKEARPIGGPPEPGSLEDKMEKYIEEHIDD